MINFYQSRIMAHINGDLFEIARFQRAPDERDMRFWTAGLSGPWRLEIATTDRKTITKRWHCGGPISK